MSDFVPKCVDLMWNDPILITKTLMILSKKNCERESALLTNTTEAAQSLMCKILHQNLNTENQQSNMKVVCDAEQRTDTKTMNK